MTRAIIVAVALLATTAPGFAQTTLYRCEVVQRMSTLALTGRPAPSTYDAQRRDQIPALSFDAATGLLRWEGPAGVQSVPLQYRILQRSIGPGYDVLATRDGGCVVSCDFEVLRIRPWHRPTTFSLLDGNGNILTGTCVP